MISVTCKVMKNVYKAMAGRWDFGFCFQHDDQGTGRLLVYDDDSEWGMFIRFVVCPDVSTVFITHVHGSFYDGLAPLDDDPFRPLQGLQDIEDRLWECVMPRLFEGYHVVPFDALEFDLLCNKVRRRVAELAHTLSLSSLPLSVVYHILRPEVPEWLTYDHELTEAEFPKMEDHEQYMNAHFYDLPHTNSDTVTLVIAQ